METPQVILGRGRHGGDRPLRARGGRPADRTALRHLRLQRRARHRRRLPEHGASGCRLRAGGHAGRRGRDRRPAVRRLDERAARRRPGRGRWPPGGCTPGWSGGPWNAGSTRAGTCIPAQLASRYAATYGFFREGLPLAVRPAARLRRPHCGRAAGGARPPRGRWPATWPAGWTAARSRQRRWRPWPGWTGPAWTHSAVPGPAASGSAGLAASGSAGLAASGSAGRAALRRCCTALGRRSGGARRDDHD